MDLSRLGFLRVGVCSPAIKIADPEANASTILEAYKRLCENQAAVVVTPELSLTGYSCEDLFHTDDLLARSRQALTRVAAAADGAILVVGAPWRLVDGRLLNCAFVCASGRVVGAVPKSAHPNYDEFYEQRWFTSGANLVATINGELGHFQIRRDQLFTVGDTQFAIEICEDLWAPEPPSTSHALAGASLVVNPSASNELVAKADYRRDLVRMQSARCICAYAYAGAGPTESSKDVVYGGHLLGAENGVMIAESDRFNLNTTELVFDIDWKKLEHDRSRNTTFTQAHRPTTYPIVDTETRVELGDSQRHYVAHPFVPDDETEFDARAQEILSIQSTGLARRMRAAKVQRLVLGLSGGLDSTLACLVCLDALDRLELHASALTALTMPGPGTTSHTKKTAHLLAKSSGFDLTEIPIDDAVKQHLDDIGHDGAPDITFENSQARERTQILFDTANNVGAIVVGTGDLSELALGWCTFNADHMSNYNVNVSVPKTMISYLVRWYAHHRASKALKKVLQRVIDTPITPELLPSVEDRIVQETETLVGPYELHDFFLYHYLRTGADAEKIFYLANSAFEGAYDGPTIQKWLRVFFQRFFEQQFKRTTLPPGPKVGTVSLSPRGDWRMPDEAEVGTILLSIDKLL